MAKRNAKRIAKRLKRESDEFKGVVDQCIHLLGLHGYPIQFPWEVPLALEQLISNAGLTPQGMMNAPTGSREASFDRLAGAMAAGPQAQPPPGQQLAPQAAQPAYQLMGAPQAASAPVAPPEVANVDPWAAAAEAASVTMETGHGGHRAPPQGQGSADGGLSPEQVQAMFEAKQAAMFERLAQSGVKYGGAQGPAAGKKLIPHPSVKVPTGAPPAPPRAAGGEEGHQSPYAVPGGGDGPRNPKNGMTREQMVEAIANATGKVPGAPAANPNAKPAGF